MSDYEPRKDESIVDNVVQARKKHKWDPVELTTQSKRIDRSKNIMEKYEGLKKIANLKVPRMKVIKCSNTFSVLQIHELDNMANIAGVNINCSTCGTSSISISSSSSAISLSDKEQQEELAEKWIDVVRKSRVRKAPQEVLSVICGFWTSRSISTPPVRKKYIDDNILPLNLEYIGFQETKKDEFISSFLKYIMANRISLGIIC
jgi:hypothetical protein